MLICCVIAALGWTVSPRCRCRCCFRGRAEPGLQRMRAACRHLPGPPPPASPHTRLQGTLPPAVVALILGRDAFLLGGGVAARMHFLGWRWPGMAEWCRVQPPPAAAAAAPASAAAAPPALPRLQPLYISKVNTVFQLGLAGACMLDAWLGAPGWSGQLVTAATWLTAGTTAASCAAYVPVLKGVAAGRAPGQ